MNTHGNVCHVPLCMLYSTSPQPAIVSTMITPSSTPTKAAPQHPITKSRSSYINLVRCCDWRRERSRFNSTLMCVTSDVLHCVTDVSQDVNDLVAPFVMIHLHETEDTSSVVIASV